MSRNRQETQDQIDLSIICEGLLGRKKSFNLIFLGVVFLILLLAAIKYLPILYTIGVKYQYYCHHEAIRSNLFYIDIDLDTITPQQRQLFDNQNKICNITVLKLSVLPSYIEIWNQLESQQFGDNIIIQKNKKYSKDDKRLLLILLQMYMNGQTYLYPTQLLYKMQPKCLWRSYHGSQLIFNKIDHYNQTTNIYIPSKNFTMLKVGYKNNWLIKKLIKSIVKGQDFLQICKRYQCAIMDCDKPSEGLKNYNSFFYEIYLMQNQIEK